MWQNGGFMKLKRLAALFMTFLLTVSMLSGCGKKENSASGNESGGGEDVVTLKWIQVGNEMPDNYDAWQKNINEYLAEKIGVNIDVEVVPWGDWDNRRSVIVNSGEYFDILFTDGSKYASEVGLGAFLDITDLVKEKTPKLYESMPQNYWDAVSVNGKIYSVPTYKDSSATQYMIWDKELADKYNIDYNNIHTFEEADAGLKKIKDGEGITPFISDKRGMESVIANYDQMGAGLPPLGVYYDDVSYKVVSVFEQEDVLKQLDMLHKWYSEGILNADAPTLDEAPNYRAFYLAQGWSGAAKTTWGPKMGTEAVAVQYGKTIVSNSTVRGSLNGIYSGTKYPEKCLEFLELVNTDSKVRDAFYYGLEGENFQYTEDGKIEKLDNEWSMAGYTQGTFFNVTQLAEEEINQWEEVKELNATATPSVLLGFNLDTSKIETELANCRAVYEKYKSELLTGAKEPRKLVKTIREELDAAGFETILEEAQTQVNETMKVK